MNYVNFSNNQIITVSVWKQPYRSLRIHEWINRCTRVYYRQRAYDCGAAYTLLRMCKAVFHRKVLGREGYEQHGIQKHEMKLLVNTLDPIFILIAWRVVVRIFCRNWKNG